MKRNFKLLLLVMFANTAMAQVQLDKVKIPADTRLYLQNLEKVTCKYALGAWALR